MAYVCVDIRDQRRKDTKWGASWPSHRKNRGERWQDKVCDRECESDEGCAGGPEDPYLGRFQEYTYCKRSDMQPNIGVTTRKSLWKPQNGCFTYERTILMSDIVTLGLHQRGVLRG